MYVVMPSRANMPASCRGQYANVAVVELEPGFEGHPKMISPRARGVKRIVKRFGPQNVGKTERCAYKAALREAHEMVNRLNSQAEG